MKGRTATFINASYKDSKDSVIKAAKARKCGGRVAMDNEKEHHAKEIGAVAGGNAFKSAGKKMRSTTAKPLVSKVK